MSEISLKQRKEEAIETETVKINKRAIHRNDQFEIKLTPLNLKSQLAQRKDAFALSFVGNKKEVTDETLRILAKTIKSMKGVRKIVINCNECKLLTDQGLKHLGEGLKGASSLKYLSLTFQWCKGITDEGLKNLGEGFRRLNSLRSLSVNFEL